MERFAGLSSPTRCPWSSSTEKGVAFIWPGTHPETDLVRAGFVVTFSIGAGGDKKKAPCGC